MIPVSDTGDPGAVTVGRAQIADGRALLFRVQFRLDHVEVQRRSKGPRAGADVTGQHDEGRRPQRTQLFQSLKGVFAQGIGDHDVAAVGAVHRHMNGRPGFGRDLVPDPVVFQQARIADIDMMAGEEGADALAGDFFRLHHALGHDAFAQPRRSFQRHRDGVFRAAFRHRGNPQQLFLTHADRRNLGDNEAAVRHGPCLAEGKHPAAAEELRRDVVGKKDPGLCRAVDRAEMRQQRRKQKRRRRREHEENKGPVQPDLIVRQMKQRTDRKNKRNQCIEDIKAQGSRGQNGAFRALPGIRGLHRVTQLQIALRQIVRRRVPVQQRVGLDLHQEVGKDQNQRRSGRLPDQHGQQRGEEPCDLLQRRPFLPEHCYALQAEGNRRRQRRQNADVDAEWRQRPDQRPQEQKQPGTDGQKQVSA